MNAPIRHDPDLHATLRLHAPQAQRLAATRARTLALVDGFDDDDLVAQAMPDASPAKWHLAHTTWFFEAMVLQPLCGHAPVDPRWSTLFNAGFDALGPSLPAALRGLLTRPTLADVLDYRRAIDAALGSVCAARAPSPRLSAMLEFGLQHEQRHQERLVADLKYLLFQNPLRPGWRPPAEPGQPIANAAVPPRLRWIEQTVEGMTRIGAAAGAAFAFDHERPRHSVWLRPFALATRPVTNAEYFDFVASGGYEDPRWWLAEGWARARAEGWSAPLYWERDGREWLVYTPAGMQRPVADQPVCHVSHYEADAYARWAGARLPTEAEWETVAGAQIWTGAFADDDRFHPASVTLNSFGGNAWEWTASAYGPYPGWRAPAAPLADYNGKFMSGRLVLRGGSCACPADHVRASYRLALAPSARWHFSGFRLAKDLA